MRHSLVLTAMRAKPIHLWCSDSELVREISMAIGGAYDIALVNNRSGVDAGLCGHQCLLVCLTLRLDGAIGDLLRALAEPVNAAEISGCPIVFVEDSVRLSQYCTPAMVAHGSIERAAIRATLVDAIAQECARAAIRFAQMQLRAVTRIHVRLRAALLAALHPVDAMKSVRDLSARIKVNEATLHHYWTDDGLRDILQLSLKDFLDLVLLLRARSRKTPNLSWDDVAREFGTSRRHLCEISRRRAHVWLGDKHTDGWIALANRLRDCKWSVLLNANPETVGDRNIARL